MNPANFIAVATALISALSVIAMSLQIRSNVKLNRNNQTFKKIEELDEILYHRSELRKIIKDIHLIDDCEKSLSIMEAGEILKDNDLYIYEILNFFESLSLSVISKNIDEKILKKIYGQRICEAYKKLHPFIRLIADKYEDPNTKPYQHFSLLYNNLKKRCGGRNGY